MSTNIRKMHLDSITAEVLLQTKEEGFASMASSHNIINGSLELGVTCKGMFIVVARKKGTTIKWEYETPEEAISKYAELLTDGE